MLPETPDTIILISSLRPYVCIGFHQDIEREVDRAYCRRAGLPIYRREIGGGAVYLDRDQLFTQWVFHRSHLPDSVEERFRLHIRPLVDTYVAFGIAAYHRPLNDIHVEGRKIGGTGAGSLGDAEVVVGSLMFDFDSGVMAKVLRVGSEKMRDKLHRSLQQYVTGMARELGQAPDRETVKRVYLEKCGAALGREIVGGALTEREELEARRWDALFVSKGWLHQRGGLQRKGVKIHEGVRVVEAGHKAPGGLIRVVVRLRDGCIDDLALSGDFTLLPAPGVGALEEAARGLAADPGALLGRFREVYGVMGLRSPGVAPEDFAEAVLMATNGG